MQASHEERSDDVRDQLRQLSEFLSPELIRALTEVAQTEERWRQTAADFEGFLKERNITAPPPDTAISFFRASPPGVPPNLQCEERGMVQMCEIGPVETVCLASVTFQLPRRPHGAKHPPKITICLASIDVPSYRCWCVPIEELAVAHAKAVEI